MELDMLSLRSLRWSLLAAVACAGPRAAGSPPRPAAPNQMDPPPAPTGASLVNSASPIPKEGYGPCGCEQGLGPVAIETPDATSGLPEHDSVTPPQPAPLPAGTTVLHVGDSMAGALGMPLKRRLTELGLKPLLRYQTASFIPGWASGAELPSYLARYQPDLVLITLGTNEVQIQDPSIRIPQIRKLVARLEGRPCVWIAPPLWELGDTGLLPIIRENCAPCLFMDTNELYPDMPRLKDKVHPTMPAREEWAARVIAWLAAHRNPQGARPWDLFGDPGTNEK